MEWGAIGTIGFILVMIGGIIGGLMFLRDRLLKKRREELVKRVAKEVTGKYLPAMREYNVEMTGEIMDKLMEKIPGMVMKITEDMKKIEEEEY